MSRLPTPGSDSGTWGAILNDFLTQAHNGDGTLKDAGITSAKLNTGSGSDGQILTKDSSQPGGMKWSAAGAQIFVQSTDPGGAASDGDIWIDTSL